MKSYTRSMKKILSFILAVTFVFSMSNGIPITVTATDSYDGFNYEILNGTYCAITGYTGTETEIVIPSEINSYIVQQISDEAFYNNTTIEKVVFPETMEAVGSSLFYGCTSLTYVGFNSKLTNIGDSMFYGCTALTKMTIPNGITYIGWDAFAECTGLT